MGSMTKRIYRICLAVAIIVIGIAGIFYYMNYKESESFSNDATLVQYTVSGEGKICCEPGRNTLYQDRPEYPGA